MAGPNVIILGATSMVAERYARLQAARGARLVLAGRRPDRLAELAADLTARGAEAVHTAAIDLAGLPVEEISGVWKELSDRLEGRVDVVLLAYGILGDHAMAERDPVDLRDIFNVDLVSACIWLSEAARHLEGQGHGTLIGIGSVAGDRGRRRNYIYGAAKSGLAVFMEGLAHRFAGSAVTVLLVKPGLIATPMTDGMSRRGPLWSDPETVAADIDRAACRGKTLLYTPWFWRWIMLVIRLMPQAIFNRLDI